MNHEDTLKLKMYQKRNKQFKLIWVIGLIVGIVTFILGIVFIVFTISSLTNYLLSISENYTAEMDLAETIELLKQANCINWFYLSILFSTISETAFMVFVLFIILQNVLWKRKISNLLLNQAREEDKA